MSERIVNLFEQQGEEICCIDRFIGDDAIIKLSKDLSGDKSKRRLILRGNCIAEKGATALADMLKLNTSLEQLSLDWNLLGEVGTGYIAKGLEVNVSLKQVDLRNNGINDEGAGLLAEGLTNNTTIESLDLRWNQIGDRGAQALLDVIKATEKNICVNLHGNPITASILSQFDKRYRIEEESPVTVAATPATVFHPNHNHDNFIDSLQKDNTQLRRQCTQSQALLSDYQRQLDTSALKIIEHEQDADRMKFRLESVTEELNQAKLRISQLMDEQQSLKQSMQRERHEMSDKYKTATKQHDLDEKTYRAEIDALQSKLKLAEESNRAIEEMLDHTREKHKTDVEVLEKRWREEQQLAYDQMQQCKDAKQEALDTKDDLVTSKQMIVHYENMMKNYDKRIDDINTHHSEQLHTLMENHRKEMADYGNQSSEQAKAMAALQAKYASVETALAKLEIDKLQEIEHAAVAEREQCTQRFSGQVSELKSRVEAYLNTKTILEERCSELVKELQETRKEHENFAQEMKISRQDLLEENTVLKNTNSNLKTAAASSSTEMAHLQSQLEECRHSLEDSAIEKKEVYASLQDSVTDRQRLLELTEKLKHRLDTLNTSRLDEFERVERSVLSCMEKEFETLKIQLKMNNPKLSSSRSSSNMLSAAEKNE